MRVYFEKSKETLDKVSYLNVWGQRTGNSVGIDVRNAAAWEKKTSKRFSMASRTWGSKTPKTIIMTAKPIAFLMIVAWTRRGF